MEVHDTNWFWSMVDWITHYSPVLGGVFIGMAAPVMWWANDRKATKNDIRLLQKHAADSIRERREFKESLAKLESDVTAGFKENAKKHDNILQIVGHEIGDLKNTIITLLKHD